MAYWSCARLEQNRVDLGLHFLKLGGFETYCPRIRVERNGGADGTALLFPSYSFVRIEMQWLAADRSPGVIGLIMDGEHPGRVPDDVIAELRGRERDGLVVLPKPSALARGDRLRIVAGPFQHHFATFESLKPRERVIVLLSLFGASRSVELRRQGHPALERAGLKGKPRKPARGGASGRTKAWGRRKRGQQH